MKFKQGDRVVWDVERTTIPVGEGTICGIASIGQVIVGRQMIVRLDKILSEDYPYDTIVVFEKWLKAY
jgi:hypothetical protein